MSPVTPSSVRPLRPKLAPLAKLRRRLVAWYVGTTVAILFALGGALFVAVAHQAGVQLDESLDEAVTLVSHAAINSPARGHPAADHLGDPAWAAASALRVPGLQLYLFDSTGTSLFPDVVIGPGVRGAALEAARHGVASFERPSASEQVERIRARSVRARNGQLLIAIASADLEDLEDRYTLLIWQFAIAAFTAVVLSAIGGAWLAKQSAAPIEAAVVHMREFMADAAHELRTPVSVLRAEADVAATREREPALDALAFGVITHETRKLAGVVDDLFTLAHAESGERTIERLPVFFDDLVSDGVVAVSGQAAAKGVALHLSEFEEARVVGDATLLARLIGALLDNAIKYTPRGGSVRVSVRPAGRGVTLTTEDSGIGIPADDLPHVFDRFFRAHDARRAASGAGLGLAIAKWIVEAHDGTIAISSVSGVGTTVVITLPSARGALDQPG